MGSLFKFILLTLLLGCSSRETPPKKPLVLVSVGPYQSLFQEIVGDSIEVLAIVPPATNPHLFEPTASQVKTILQASIWFRIGEPFENRLLPLLGPRLIVHDLRGNVDLLFSGGCSHCREGGDRHIWLSPKRTLLQLEEGVSILSRTFPEKEALFQQNLAKMKEKLVALDQKLLSFTPQNEGKALFVSHGAFAYFCHDYNLEEISIETEGKEVSFQTLDALLETARKKRIAYTLALPEHNNKGAQLIAKKLHLPVRWIDPYGKDYFHIFEELIDILYKKEAL